jgi:hypothetical protein
MFSIHVNRVQTTKRQQIDALNSPALKRVSISKGDLFLTATVYKTQMIRKALDVETAGDYEPSLAGL